MNKILLIDDCEDIGPLLAQSIGAYHIDQSRTVAEAMTRLHDGNYDLLLIDVTLPDGNGFDLCQELCRDMKYKGIPKILITGHNQVSEKVYGFNCGADDYVTKPFNAIELKARIDRYLTKKGENEQRYFYPPFEFQLDFQKCLSIDGQKRKDLGLTPTEFRLLYVLCRNADRVVTRQELEQLVWKEYGVSIERRGVDTHVAHLRKKLGPLKKLVVSIYGQGYSVKPMAS